MNSSGRKYTIPAAIAKLQRWFSQNLGVSTSRKEVIYLDIVQSVTLFDISYWTQVLFAAGIATLGLVLNSPAVIIGAMLISPLMGSILANGLALAAGDVILALRALLNLFLSCVIAIIFAFLLVSLLPFKEMTSEILARTRPNLLDLGIALFSGAVGSIVLCKEPKGIATSIPGVSIAVALMPPLCVVGYGIGIALSLNPANGFQVARGGGLLFFTNLVAITFMAMLVFLALHIDNASVRERMRQWRQQDRESIWMQQLIDRIPASKQLKKIGSLPGRLLLIVMTILLISLPLNQSLSQLRSEIILKQEKNQLRKTITEIWRNYFATLPTGAERSYISKLSFQNQSNQLLIQLQAVTSKTYTEEERQHYLELLATKLSRPLNSISLNLIQIPTAASNLSTPVPEDIAPPPPTIPELQTRFLQGIDTALESLSLPSPAQWISYEASTSSITPLKLQLFYLSQRDIDRDGQALLTQTIRSQLNYPTAEVILRRVTPLMATIPFEVNQTDLLANQTKNLDPIGLLLQQYPPLQVVLNASEDPLDIGTPAQARSLAICAYFKTKWQIPAERCLLKTGTESKPIVRLQIIMPSSAPATSASPANVTEPDPSLFLSP